MATVKYLAFDVSNKARVNLGGGNPIVGEKLVLFNGTNYTFRIVLWQNFDEIYSTSNTNFKIKIREKRQSTTDLILVDTSSFLSSLWTSTDEISLVSVFDVKGKFKAGDIITGVSSESFATVLGFSEDNGYLVYKPRTVGQYFDYEEIIAAVYGTAGYTGVEGKLGLEESIMSYNVSEGWIACTCDLNDTDLDTFMEGKEQADLIMELTEIDGGGASTVLGQCEIKMKNTFV